MRKHCSFGIPTFLILMALFVFGCGDKQATEQASPKVQPKAKNPVDEPPMSLGGSVPGERERSCELVNIDFGGGKIVYNVTYHVHNLRSTITIGFSSRALHEEVFPNKWKVVYDYDQEHKEHYQIPVAFTIYGFSQRSGAYDRVINKYRIERITPDGVLYRDDAGRKKVLNQVYFMPIPQPSGRGF